MALRCIKTINIIRRWLTYLVRWKRLFVLLFQHLSYHFGNVLWVWEVGKPLITDCTFTFIKVYGSCLDCDYTVRFCTWQTVTLKLCTTQRHWSDSMTIIIPFNVPTSTSCCFNLKLRIHDDTQCLRHRVADVAGFKP